MAADQLDALRAALAAQYTIERILGQGGMGAVYLARDTTLDRPVAIKVISQTAASDSTVRDRFLLEARTVAKLRHPNIVPVFAAGDADGLLYFVMEFVPGESLRDLMAREQRVTGERAERILREVALALDHAHSQGLVHRDIKPENILIDAESGRAMLTDFGVSRAFEKDGGLTQTGMILGSPRYMSPEQASGDRALDGRSDLYSLALVGYELYTGAPVVQSGTVASMLVKHLTETPAPIAEKVSDIPRHVAAAIDHGLAKNPDERWQTGRQFAEAIAGQTLTPSGEVRAPLRPATAASRKRAMPWMVAGGVAVAAAAAWFAFGRTGKTGNAYLVTPFEIQSGDASVNWLRDGSVNMLTLTLGQWADLHVVDYERTLSLIDKAGLSGKAHISLDDALSLARRAGAGTVVTGQIQTLQSSLLVVAKLYDVKSGNSRNQASDSIALGSDPRPLFDRLAQRLLQIAGGPTTTMQLAQATTSSIAAYRSYLNGVGLLNGWRLNDADTAFAHAVALDSTFALALHKRSLGLGWGDGVANPEYLAITEKALALDARLPARERSLVEGHYHLAHALGAALVNDTAKTAAEFTASIKAYNDLFARGDTLVAEAWYGLADAYFHGRPVNNNAVLLDYTKRALRGFNKTLAIDSTFHLAYSHLVQLYNSAGAGSNLLIVGDSVILLAEEADIRKLGGQPAVQQLRAAARARGVEIAKAWMRADQGSTQAFLQLSQSYMVAGQRDSATAVLREALSRPRAGSPAARLALISVQQGADTALETTVRYVLDHYTRDSLHEVPRSSRFAAEGEMLAATATIGRTADLEKAGQLFIASDSVLPGSTVPASVFVDWYKSALRLAMGEPMSDGMKRGLLGGVQGLDKMQGPIGDQGRGGSVSIPYLAYLTTRDTAFLGPVKRWLRGPTPELDAIAALARGDSAGALTLAKALPRPDSILKTEARYTMGGMRGIARAQVLADLGLTRQAAETYEAIPGNRLNRASLAEPGFAVWVRSLLAQARLWKQLGERDKSIAAYEQFLLRWKNADGVAATQVKAARLELAQLRDSPRTKAP